MASLCELFKEAELHFVIATIIKHCILRETSTGYWDILGHQRWLVADLVGLALKYGIDRRIAL